MGNCLGGHIHRVLWLDLWLVFLDLVVLCAKLERGFIELSLKLKIEYLNVSHRVGYNAGFFHFKVSVLLYRSTILTR